MAIRYLFSFFFFFLLFFSIPATYAAKAVARGPSKTKNGSGLGVQLRRNPKEGQVVIDNGIVEVTFSSPGGDVIGIKYNGLENVLEIVNEEDNRGYWDVVWNKPRDESISDKLDCTDFTVITENENQVEISFSKKWNPSDANAVPLNVDKRYIVRRGSSGLYVYAILERLKGWPDVDMDQIRVVFKLQQKKFHFMAVSDDRQRIMPMPQDRTTGQPLAYPEAVLLTRPINPEFKGEVDDKYQYSLEDKDNKVHGWISDNPSIGFWMITPSNEFKVGGPIKQDLTSHVGPIVLNMFTSVHYTGKDLITSYRGGEPWKKVLGPVFVYLNANTSRSGLWEDAKRQTSVEVGSWPYNFPQSVDFPKAAQRGSVSGQLMVRDRYINKMLMFGSSAYVGLAAPGEVGSWQTEAKGYQFWTQADKKGQFVIPNVRPGTYNLYGWVPGFIGDFKYHRSITIKPGSAFKLGSLTFDPPRNGPTLWEIGIPDRTAAEFFVPATSPTLKNKLYDNLPGNTFRQYGLWERYTDLYPRADLVYDVNTSNCTRHWFFAHVNRIDGKTVKPTTWQIVFQLRNINRNGNYTLRIALASVTNSNLLIRINNPNPATRPLFKTGFIGKDNAIARHGIHGLYWLFNVGVPSDRLVVGRNTIYINQPKDDSAIYGVMYDYLRFEGPATA